MYNLFFLLLIFVNLMGRVSAKSQMELDWNALEQELKESIFFDKAPGLAVSVCMKEVCRQMSVGTEDPKNEFPLPKGGLFRIGSLSKSMVAVLIMKSVEEGRLNLEDQLGTFLPRFKKWRNVTVKQLLRMESGVPAYLFRKESSFKTLSEIVRRSQVYIEPEHILDEIMDLDLDYQPGRKSVYNNSNYVLLGLILEQVYQEKLESLLDRYIFSPLNLTHTYLDLGLGRDQFLTKGFLQTYALGVPKELAFLFPSALQRGDGMVDLTDGMPAARVWASGAVVSSAEEMNKYMRALISGQLLSANSLEQMKQYVVTSILGKPFLYGLGLMAYPSRFGVLYGHGGFGVGYQNMAYYLPDYKLSIAVAHNVGPSDTYVVFDRILEFVLGNDQIKQFVPDQSIAHSNDANSINLRLRDRINSAHLKNEGFGSSGFAFFNRKLQPAQSFNYFQTREIKVQGEAYVHLQGQNLNIFEGMVTDEAKKVSIIDIFVKKDAMKVAEARGVDIIEFEQLSYKYLPFIVAVGKKEVNPGVKDASCYTHLIDANKKSQLQFSLQKNNSTEVSDTIKLVGALATRKANDRDSNHMLKFGLNLCK